VRPLLVVGASEIVTLAGGLRRGAAQADVALVGDRSAPGDRSALVVREARILGIGPVSDVRRRMDGVGLSEDDCEVIDATGATVTPGLIDAHTHLLFAGSREGELTLRQRGASYLEILAAGGGILSTVAATRAASRETLLAHGRRWLDAMLRQGVTTIEAKSGYGLETDAELRLLELAKLLGETAPIEVVPTFLGAHAIPSEYRDRSDGAEAYTDAVVSEQLPRVVEQGIARFCDVFCEPGVFSVEQSRRVLVAAERLGLEPRVHADELANSGGAELAAEVGAASADHLASVSENGIGALAAAAERGAAVVATLLPATTLNLMSDHYAPARRLIDAGVPVGLGTDFNPGTSPTPNLPLVMSLACLRLGMTPAEALTAVTINAAHSLRLADRLGSLEEGKQADVVIWDVPSYTQIPYWVGAPLTRVVIKRGEVVFARDEPGFARSAPS
jgi:imidazolonepropionase